MKSIFAVAVLVFVGMLGGNPAMAQQPCVWGTPTWTATSDATSSTTGIRVSCNGGITQCNGKLVVSFWVYDPLAQDWVPYQPPGMQWETLATTKLCGETYSYAEYISHDKWPMATDCCVSLDWYVWNGATYTFAATHDNFFTTP